jgi:heme exporter protein B
MIQPAAMPEREPHSSLPRSANLRPPGWLGQTLLVLRKDLLIELHTGEVVTTSTFFAVLVVVMASLSFYGGPDSRALIGAGVIWLSVAFAAVLALARSWQRERQESALDGLLVTPVSRSAIFAGKALGILLFLFIVEAVVVPLASVFIAIDLWKVGAVLVLICLAATPGVAAAGTLFGAMTVRTRARDLMLAIVLFPLLTPTLLAAVAATRDLLGGATLGELVDYLKIIGVFDIVFTAGGLYLFGTLVER